MKHLWFSICFGLLVFAANSQPREIDSLKQVMANTQNNEEKVMILSQLIFHYLVYRPDSALLLSQRGLELARKINYPLGEARMFINMGLTYMLLSDIPNAMRASLQGLQLAEKHGFQQEKAYGNLSIGMIYVDLLKDYRTGLNYLKKADKWNTPIKDLFGAILHPHIYLNIGKSFVKLNRLDSAEFYFAALLNYTKPIPGWYQVVSNQMGLIQIKLKDYDKAISLFKRANAILVDHRTAAEINFNQAFCFREKGQIDSCLFYAHKSLHESQTINYQQYVIKSANLLIELYNASNNPIALRYYRIAKLANEKVFGERKVLELQRIITEDLQRQQIVERERIAFENRTKQYALLGGLSVVLLVAFILYRTNLQKQKTNVVLEKTLSTLQSTQAQLIQSEKLASLGELTAGIAHEIQNPLNFVNNFAEVSTEMLGEMKEEIKAGNTSEVIAIADDLEQNLSKINHHGQRASSIVKGMLEHSRQGRDVASKVSTDLNALTDEYLRLAYHGWRAKDNSFNCTIETHFEPDLPRVEVVPQDIGRVLLNLINNAFYAVQQQANAATNVETRHALSLQRQPQPSPAYQPTVTVSTQKTGDQIRITIQDNGNGIPEAIREKIFQPFFTTKPTGQGTGLGLSLAYDIITKGHGGALDMITKEGVGTEFVIKLPA